MSKRGTILPLRFYLRPTLEVARDLIGKIFEHTIGETVLQGRIAEVEAYHQSEPASHSFRGKTPRNEIMFGIGGVLYVYFTYGMHHCMNVVTEGEGVGAAVLIRAVEPMKGIEVMQQNRGPRHAIRNLTNGPGKVCQAFGIDRSHNGVPLTGPAIRILNAPAVPQEAIVSTPRIGITHGRDLDWRFSIRGNPFVSR